VTVRRFSALFTLFILLVVVWAVWEAREWELGRRFTPWMIGIPTALLLAAALVQDLRRRGGTGGGSLEGASFSFRIPGGLALPEEATPMLEPAEERRRTANIIVWVVGFALAIWLLGFHVGIPLLSLLYLKLAGREGWPISLLLVAGLWASSVLFFDCTVHIFFIPGELFVWLGLDPRAFWTQLCQALPW
jgi:hypothetical protein